ncbi:MULTISPECIES: DUF4346 domain-containing protein [unclassified Microcoleus]
MPAIKTEHIGYLGVELQKAAQCWKTQATYTQDLSNLFPLLQNPKKPY